ncbi:MAG: hypothetical protein J6R82_01280 [Clostridia bacterium]|nr:hypothetical protein [Clostridia bacterium]
MAKKQKRDDIVARADDAFGSSNYAEFVVEKKVEGRYKMQRLLMLLGYAVVAIVVVVAVAISGFIPLIALAPTAVWMLSFFTWPLVSIEYGYTVDASVFTVEKIMGGKKKSKLFETKVKELSLIAPYDEQYKADADNFAADQRIEAVSSMDCYDLYFALHTAEDGKKTIVFFQATTQSLKALKYYNSAAIVMRETFR